MKTESEAILDAYLHAGINRATSLLDYFAAQALPLVMHKGGHGITREEIIANDVKLAYDYAQSMVKEKMFRENEIEQNARL